MNRITHFEIYTDDPQAVQPFYQDVFGWKFNKFEGGPIEYWLVTTGDDKQPGINGGMTRPREGQSPGTLNTVAVKFLEFDCRRGRASLLDEFTSGVSGTTTGSTALGNRPASTARSPENGLNG